MIVARCNGKTWWVVFEGTELVIYMPNDPLPQTTIEVTEFVEHLGLGDAITDEGVVNLHFMYQTYEITQARVPGPRRREAVPA